ncbi:MAG: hypothetical protein VB066_13195 [Paludibacter sp.]|nr:hypothetical protein [Paludibacter sp.]
MKNIYYFLISLLLLFSCEENVSDKLMVSSTSVTLSNSKTYAEITITKGAGNYSVSSSNEAVAQCFLIDDKLYITGFNIGTAIITLTDQNENKVEITVTIDELIYRIVPVTNLVMIKTGDTKSITNSDPNPLYYLMDTASVIEIGGTKNNLQITALKKGNALLYYLKEYWPTAIYNIQIIDHYLFTVTPTTSSLRLNTGAEAEYYILSGCGNYALTISDTNVLSAELLAWPVEPTINHNNPRIVRIRALQRGSSELKITNVETEEVKTVAVTVG